MKLLLTLFLAFYFSNTVGAQDIDNVKQALANGGGTAINGSIHLNYTIGQSTNLGLAHHQTTLLQQGFQTGFIEGEEGAFEQDNLEVHVWPNPATEKITIKLDVPSESNVSVQLFDLEGTLILVRGHHTNDEIEISLEGIARGVYELLLEVDGIRKAQKIIKL